MQKVGIGFIVLLLFVILVVACQPAYGGSRDLAIESEAEMVNDAVLVTREDGLECLVYMNLRHGISVMSCDWEGWKQ